MSKVNRIIASLLSAVFIFNNINYDVIVKAVSEQIEQSETEKTPEAEEVETEAETSEPSDNTVSEETDNAEASASETDAGTVSSEIAEEGTENAGETDSASLADEMADVTTQTENQVTEKIKEDESSDKGSADKESPERIIDSETVFEENMVIEDNLTVNSKFSVREGAVLEVKGNLIVGTDGEVNITDSDTNIIIRGNLIVDGVFNNNGSIITIDGNYIQNSGKFALTEPGAIMKTAGNLTIQGDSVFEMKVEETNIIVDGNFTVKNDNINYISNGVIRVKGDFIQKGNGNNFKLIDKDNNVEESDLHEVNASRVILDGDGKQKISFESPTTVNSDKIVKERKAQFATLELTRARDAYEFTNDFYSERIYENVIEPSEKELSEVKNAHGGAFKISNKLYTPLSHFELVYSNGNIILAGGKDETGNIHNEISVYNISKKEWEKAGSLNTGRTDYAAASVNKDIYVFGGFDGTDITGTTEKIAEDYSSAVVELKSGNELIARRSHKAVSYNGKIYIMGGENKDGEILKTLEVFDPQNKTVEVKKSMQTERKDFGASFYFNGDKVYIAVAGGVNSTGILKSVEFYDVENDEWKAQPDLNAARKGFGLNFLMGKLFVTGGIASENESGVMLAETTEEFEGTKWSTLKYDADPNSGISQNRGYFGSVTAYNSIFIAGGETPSVTDVFEQFMPMDIPAVRFKENTKGLNGDFTQEITDLAFNSPVQSFSLDRVFNSQFKDEISWLLGYGWKFSFESSLKIITNKKGIVKAPYLYVRDNPWGNVVDGLGEGTVIEVIGEKTDYEGKIWYQIGDKRYVASWYVDDVENNAAEVTYPDGTKGYFTEKDKVFSGNIGTYDKIRATDEGNYELITKEQVRYVYAPLRERSDIYRNTAVIDRYGNKVSIEYISGSNKVEITNSSGEKIEITQTDRTVTATDGNGRKVIYNLDDDDELSSVTDVNGLTTKYFYRDHNITKIINDDDSEKTLCEIEYDKFGRISKYTDADNNESFTYYEDVCLDESDDTLGIFGDIRRSIVDPNGNTTTTTYSLADKKPVKVLDAEDGFTKYRYEIEYNDKYYDVTDIKDITQSPYKEMFMGQYPTRETVTDPNNQTTVIEKDERGNITKKINPDGSIIEYKFDSNNNLIEEIKNNIHVEINIGYTVKTKYTYEDGIYLSSVEYGSSGAKETYTYDESSAVKGLVKTKETKRSDSASIKTDYTYYSDGQLKSVSAGSKTTYYGYIYNFSDANNESEINGKTISLEKPNNNYENNIYYAQVMVKPEGNMEISYCDRKLNQIKSTLSNSDGTEKSTSLLVYDKQGNLIREVSPEVYAESPETADSLNDSCHIYKYTNSGLLKEETDAEGNTTYYEYDKTGNLIKLTEPGNAVYIYKYDGLNRLISKSFTDGSVSYKLESFTYERGTSWNKALKRTHTEYIDGERDLVTNTYYDYAGRETYTDTPYKKTEKEYLGNGNLYRERVYDTADVRTCTSDVLFFYNDRGLADIILTGYKPDKEYFITKNIYTYDGLLEYEINYLEALEVSFKTPVLPEKAKASVTKYEYDEAGNIISESTFTGEFSISDISAAKFAVKTKYEYDIPNNTVTEKTGNIKTVYVNNYLDKPVAVKNIVNKSDIIADGSENAEGETALVTSNSYDRNGNLIKTVTPSGTVTEYSYDKLNRMTVTKYNDVPSEDEITGTLTESLSYNQAGSVTNKILKFNDQVKSESAYYYDSRNNLILSVDKADGKEAASSFEYNNAGWLIAEASPESFSDLSSEETDPVKKYAVSNASGYTKYTYDLAGRLKTKEFNGTTYKFDEETGTIKPADDSFVISAFSYDANDNVIKEVDGEEYAKSAYDGTEAKGRTYTYSGTNELLSEKSPECDRDYSVLYEYDALGNITLKKALKGTSGAEKFEITTTDYVQGADGITVFTQKTFEGEGEDISSAAPLLSVQTWKTDINDNTIEESTGKNTVKTEYNSLGLESRAVTETDRYTENESEKIVNSEIKTIYDKEGNAVLSIHNSGIVEVSEYDRLRRLVSKTTGKRPADVSDNQLKAADLTDSVTLKWTYDVKGNVRYEYDGNGFMTEYRYDGYDKLVNTIRRYGSDRISEEKVSYDQDGNITEEITLLDGKQTGKKSYVYDGFGRVVQKSDADVTYEFIEYNRSSDQTVSVDAGKVKKQFEYDAERRLTKTIFAGLLSEELEYDYAGNVCRKTDGEGNSAIYSYDVMDRLVKVSSSHKDSETETETSSYTYNEEGNIASKTAGSRNKITYQYTASNQIKETNTNGRTEKFFYDTDGNLAKSVDPSGNETIYTYNSQGLTAKEEVKSGGNVVISRTYTYDKNGNVLKSSVKENGKENVITRTYDELGRVTKKESTGSVTSEFVYDMFTEDDLLYEVNRYSNGESSSNVYDEFGRLKYVYSTDISAGDDSTKRTEYRYDIKGRRESISYPNGAKSTYEYYSNNNVKLLSNFIKDKNAADEESQYKEIERYEYSYYDNNTMSGKKEYYDGVLQGETVYEYDDLLRLVSTNEKRNGKEYRNISYSYDDSGNRIKEESIENNIKETKNYSYGDGDLLLGYTVISGEKKTDEVKYEYDKNGNLIKEFTLFRNGLECTDKDKPETLNTYNVLNQLVSTQNSDFVINNEYNSEGLRISKEVKASGVDTSEKTHYTYEYDKVIFETNEQQPESYIWNVQGINLILRQINGEMFYCMYNGHADITRMVDGNGELAEKYYYDEWGVETETLKYGDLTGDSKVTVNDFSLFKRLLCLEPSELTHEQQMAADLNADGSIDTEDLNILKKILFNDLKYCAADTNKDGFINEKNNIKYAGYMYDAETGLYYLNSRFYDPETARFMQQDTYSGDIYDPLSLNLYTYSNNNPISYYDPTGHKAKNILRSIKTGIGNAFNNFRKEVNDVKVAAEALIPVIENNVKKTAALVTNAVVQPVLKPVVDTLQYVQNKTEPLRNQIQTVASLGQTEVFGTAVNASSSYGQGVIDTIDNSINGLYKLYDDPTKTISDSVNAFVSDPVINNPGYEIWNYYTDVGKASYVHDWNTVSYKLGVGAVNLSSFYIGAKATSAVVSGKASLAATDGMASAGSRIRNVLNSITSGTPALAGANGMVISGGAISVSIPAEASLANAAVTSAAGVRVGVANAAAVGQVVYSVSGGLKQSGDAETQSGNVSNQNGTANLNGNKNTLGSKRFDYKKIFFDAHPDLQGKVYVHHAVEQQVLRKPQTKGLFSESEIHSLDNLRGIPNDMNSDLHLSKIRKEWNRFYKDYPYPTKEEILAKRAEIDMKYGNQFNPPK